MLFKNDQLMWSALVMLLFNIGTNVVGGGLGMMYVYFDNAYNGTLWMVFGLGFAAVSVIFRFCHHNRLCSDDDSGAYGAKNRAF